MKSLASGALTVLSAFLGLTACSAPANHYKITAAVNVGGRIYTGSSVQAFSCHKGASWAGSSDISQCVIYGEAVAVDLHNRGYLFLTFEGPHGDMTSAVESILNAGAQAPFSGSGEGLSGAWVVPVSALPMMVTFQNLHIPSSAVQVSPNDFSRVFGRDAHFEYVRAERTGDSITRGQIGKILPWLNVGDGSTYLSGKRISDATLAGSLQHDNFKFGG